MLSFIFACLLTFFLCGVEIFTGGVYSIKLQDQSILRQYNYCFVLSNFLMWVFVRGKVNSRISVHISLFHHIITLTIGWLTWLVRYLEHMAIGQEPVKELMAHLTSTKLFQLQPATPWTAGDFNVVQALWQLHGLSYF